MNTAPNRLAVTQARQSALKDAEIAMLIGDKTGPTIISQVYGDHAARDTAPSFPSRRMT
jgi:hypothetical protein